jgi:hypothetical protein
VTEWFPGLPVSALAGDLADEDAIRAAFGSLAGDNAWTGLQTWRGAADGSPIVAKPNTDKRAGVFDLVHNSDTGYLLHLVTGANAAHQTSALIALGIDNNGIGLLIPNKATGRGIVGDQRATVTATDAYWLHATQRSANSPLVRLEMQDNNGAELLQLLAFGTPAAGKKLLYVGDPTGEAGAIHANDGRMEWRRPIIIRDKDGSTASYLDVTDNSGVATNTAVHTLVRKAGPEFYGYSGSVGQWWPFSWDVAGSRLRLRTGGLTSTVGTPGTLTNVIEVQNAKLAFFNASPVVQPTGTPAAATDAATTQALVNSLRSSLIALGLVA